jgi:hypothetical protein
MLTCDYEFISCHPALPSFRRIYCVTGLIIEMADHQEEMADHQEEATSCGQLCPEHFDQQWRQRQEPGSTAGLYPGTVVNWATVVASARDRRRRYLRIVGRGGTQL